MTLFFGVYRKVQDLVAPHVPDLKECPLVEKELFCHFHACGRRGEASPQEIIFSFPDPSVQSLGLCPGQLAEGPQQQPEVTLGVAPLAFCSASPELLVDDTVRKSIKTNTFFAVCVC